MSKKKFKRLELIRMTGGNQTRITESKQKKTEEGLHVTSRFDRRLSSIRGSELEDNSDCTRNQRNPIQDIYPEQKRNTCPTIPRRNIVPVLTITFTITQDINPRIATATIGGSYLHWFTSQSIQQIPSNLGRKDTASSPKRNR